MKKSKKIIVIGDYHIPDENKELCNSFEKFLKSFKPDDLIINGDLLDFYDLSRFDKDVTKEGTLQQEIDRGKELLTTYRKILPKSNIYMTQSNHMEERLEKFKKSLGKGVASLEYFNVKNMLDLKKNKVKVSYQVNYKDFIVYHGNIIRQHSGYTARGALERKGKSVFINHVHRLGSHFKSDEAGEKMGVECGCMCNLKPEYIKGKPNWQQGFAVIYYDVANHWFTHDLIRPKKNKFFYKDKVY